MKKLICIAIVASWLASPSHAETTKSVGVVLPPRPGPAIENVVRILARQIQQRCDAKVVRLSTTPAARAKDIVISPPFGNGPGK